MMTIGIIVLVIGLLFSAFKAHVVWSAAHDGFNGGGVPTMDFSIFWPIPIAGGTSMILSAQGIHPFPGFGFVLYLALALFFWFLHCFFDRHGERQLAYLQQMPRPEPDRNAEPGATGKPPDSRLSSDDSP